MDIYTSPTGIRAYMVKKSPRKFRIVLDKPSHTTSTGITFAEPLRSCLVTNEAAALVTLSHFRQLADMMTA